MDLSKAFEQMGLPAINPNFPPHSPFAQPPSQTFSTLGKVLSESYPLTEFNPSLPFGELPQQYRIPTPDPSAVLVARVAELSAKVDKILAGQKQSELTRLFDAMDKLVERIDKVTAATIKSDGGKCQ